MIVDNDVNILFTSMVPGSQSETGWKKLSFTHGNQTRFTEFLNQRTIGPENAHLKPDLEVLSHHEMTLTLNTHRPLLTS